jgi:tetratricopeptide (TPR) repeat protein
MRGTGQALAAAQAEYLGLRGDPVATLAAAPGFVLGHTTIAALNCLSGVPGDAAVVREALVAARELGPASARERLHIAGAAAWAAGDIAGAAAAWEAAVAAEPGDILALRLAHDTHFFLGDAGKLRDVPVAALPAYAPGSAERGFVLGMAAFGLEETGDYKAAEAAGREAVEINPADTWGVHAVAHVLEMRGRPDEGIEWLRGLEPHWAPAAGLAVHQFWHLGLFLIEAGRLDEVIALYDARIRPGAAPMILDLVDAAALLWRLELVGADVGARWGDLAAAWSAHAQEHVLVFNDAHIAMALSGAGEEAAAEALEASVAAYAARETGTNAAVSREFGLPVIRGLLAFRAGDYAGTVAALGPLYTRLAPFGGSNAQRDLLIQTLGIAAFKTGDVALARAVAAERRRLKAGLPRAWADLPLN